MVGYGRARVQVLGLVLVALDGSSAWGTGKSHVIESMRI